MPDEPQHPDKPRHLTNRRAFADPTALSPLLAVYTRLVALEILLKDRLPAWKSGHDVCGLIEESNLPQLVVDMAKQLRPALNALICTNKAGGPAPVVASRYPVIRYLRHEDDFGSGSTDDDLWAVAERLDDIYRELAIAGEPVC